MTNDQFWTIVETARDRSSERNAQKLFEQLCVLPEKEIIAFDRIWTQCYYQLYTSLLRGVAQLARGRCNEARFKDWRHWIVSRGRKDFEIALHQPDDLVPLIDAEPEAGREGIVEVIGRALRARNSRWEDAGPEHEDLKQPLDPSGPEWQTDENLKALLPKTYARYRETAPPPVALPEPVAPAPATCAMDTRPPSQPSSNLQAKEIPVTQSPVKKPWWKVWG
ncbi:MAG TPA: DUF4240 domain-containing protein [Verrucomicrobiales bacterium]|nr:DUF4240 domain-containing protein [Verrucomicrobiales bacterium]